MTFAQAKKLKKGKSFVWYAGARYKFVRLEKELGCWFIIINDEPPGKHEDRLLLASVAHDFSAKERKEK
jgi:hypothetical protein